MDTAPDTSNSVLIGDLATSWLYLDGKPFSFQKYPMHRAFYNGRYPRMLFKTSRQIGKSITLANLSILECCAIEHFSTMFVAPSKEHTTRFSNTRLSKIIKYSPKIRVNFLQTDLSDRVFQKQYTNGSEMLLTYASDDAERLRGPSSHRNMYDEVQDMLYDPVITVGNETMSNSDYQYETYAGTPLTMENTIQYLWENSTQNEWVMQCPSCYAKQFFDSDKCLGKHGPICLKCGKGINPFFGKWVSMAPKEIMEEGTFHTKLHGFHISQLIMPANVPLAMQPFGTEAVEVAERRWARILRKHKDLSSARFNNEVVGVSDAVGTRMITIDELERCCNPDRHLSETMQPRYLSQITQRFAGVDWSGGGTKGLSRTVLWIWGYRPSDSRLVTLLYKVFPGRNPVEIVKEIADLCLTYQIQMGVGDAGEGHMPNSMMQDMLGGPHRWYQAQYGSQKHAVVWNQDRWMCDRSGLIDNYLMLLKRGGAEFAHKEEMQMAFSDILAEYEEVTLQGKKVWRHSPQKPDDCLHAGLFGWLAYRLAQGEFKFM